jgi:hypothetical protein
MDGHGDLIDLFSGDVKVTAVAGVSVTIAFKMAGTVEHRDIRARVLRRCVQTAPANPTAHVPKPTAVAVAFCGQNVLDWLRKLPHSGSLTDLAQVDASEVIELFRAAGLPMYGEDPDDGHFDYDMVAYTSKLSAILAMPGASAYSWTTHSAERLGKQLKAWLAGGSTMPPPADTSGSPPITATPAPVMVTGSQHVLALELERHAVDAAAWTTFLEASISVTIDKDHVRAGAVSNPYVQTGAVDSYLRKHKCTANRLQLLPMGMSKDMLHSFIMNEMDVQPGAPLTSGDGATSPFASSSSMNINMSDLTASHEDGERRNAMRREADVVVRSHALASEFVQLHAAIDTESFKGKLNSSSDNIQRLVRSDDNTDRTLTGGRHH